MTQPITLPRKHDKSILSLAFSFDGHYLASGGKDFTICLWDVKKQQIIRSHRLKKPQWGVTSVAFTRDGRKIAAMKQSVKRLMSLSHPVLWDLMADDVVDLGVPEPLETIACSPTQDLIAVAGNHVAFFDTNTGKRIADLPRDPHAPVAFAVDGITIATAQSGGGVGIWTVATCDRQRTITLDSDQNISNLAYCSPATPLVAYSFAGSAPERVHRVVAWDPAGNEIGQITVEQEVLATAFISGTHNLLLLGSDGVLSRWTANPLTRLEETALSPAPLAMAISADGKLLATGDEKGDIRLWEVESLFAS